MKKWFIILAVFLSMICTIGIMRWDTEETLQKEIAQQVLRFHVRANSNTEQDQKIKMKVKNAVVEYLQQLLENPLVKNLMANFMKNTVK